MALRKKNREVVLEEIGSLEARKVAIDNQVREAEETLKLNQADIDNAIITGKAELALLEKTKVALEAAVGLRGKDLESIKVEIDQKTEELADLKSNTNKQVEILADVSFDLGVSVGKVDTAKKELKSVNLDIDKAEKNKKTIEADTLHLDQELQRLNEQINDAVTVLRNTTEANEKKKLELLGREKAVKVSEVQVATLNENLLVEADTLAKERQVVADERTSLSGDMGVITDRTLALSKKEIELNSREANLNQKQSSVEAVELQNKIDSSKIKEMVRTNKLKAEGII